MLLIAAMAWAVGGSASSTGLLLSWPVLKASQTFLYPCAVKMVRASRLMFMLGPVKLS
jgi:hypothetical protein